MVRKLIYRSEAPGFNQSEIDRILSSSEKNNGNQSITGCLVYSNNFFIQMLEGEPKVVEQLFYTIEDDTRHINVEIIHDSSNESRIFRNFAMAFFNLDELTALNSDAIVSLAKKEVNDTLPLKVFMYNVEQLHTKSGFYNCPIDQ